jgi:Glyoxalase/Bleomycin resistance protein/Dioxygenase superfamily
VISPPFHSAFVVPELHSALDELGQAFGLEWATIRESKTAVWTPDGRVDLEFRGTFSKRGPSRVEIIESIPGTLWTATDDLVLHHVSFWSSDLVGDSGKLAADGYPVMATSWGETGETPTLFTYHRKGRGPYMELLDENERPHYEEWWNES